MGTRDTQDQETGVAWWKPTRSTNVVGNMADGRRSMREDMVVGPGLIPIWVMEVEGKKGGRPMAWWF